MKKAVVMVGYCLACPYSAWQMDWFSDEYECEKLGRAVDPDTIDPACPLPDAENKEE